MKLVLYGVEIQYPFEKKSVLAAVKAEIRIKKYLRSSGESESRVLEITQIQAKEFYQELQKEHGREQVDSFIRLFTQLSEEYRQNCRDAVLKGRLNLLWINVITIIMALTGTLTLAANL